jgi:hypothetical protein
MLIIDVPAAVRGFISAAGEFGHAKSGMKGPLEAGGAIRLMAFPAAR